MHFKVMRFKTRSHVLLIVNVQYGRTETIHNNLNPDFVNKFHIDYFFQESQKLEFEV